MPTPSLPVAARSRHPNWLVRLPRWQHVLRMDRRLIALVISLIAAFTSSVVVVWNLVDTTEDVSPVQLSP